MVRPRTEASRVFEPECCVKNRSRNAPPWPYFRASRTLRLIPARLLTHRGGFQQTAEFATPAIFPSALVICITGDQRHGHGGFGVDHLLETLVDLAPTAGFAERAARKRAVAHVGHGDL